MIFGVTDMNKIAIAAFAAVLVILFNSAYGVINARKQRVMAARVMGASRWQIFKDVLIWESLQPTFVGLRSGVSMALVIVIVAEMFIGSDSGLGNRIINAQQVLNVREIPLERPINVHRHQPHHRPRACRSTVRAWPARHAHHHPRPDQVLRGLAAVRRLQPGHSQRQDRLGIRPQRLRQVHADQHDRGADPHRRRRDPVRRQVTGADQDRLRLPELPRSHVPVATHHRQHRLSAAPGRPQQGRGGRPRGRTGGVIRRQVRPETLPL
ncbi:hypothetical protein G6F65_016868 [Rhizopus arrhizus]|nr:hypothetical protein G6F65_016868 [Rhizopus arrhizus]